MLRKLVTLIIALMCWGTLHATHYLGGEVTYRYLGNNTYHFTVRIYTDCHHGDPRAIAQDNPLIFGIFHLPSGYSFLTDSMFGQIVSMPPNQISGCIHDTGDYCNNYVLFEKDIFLFPSGGSGYMFV